MALTHRVPANIDVGNGATVAAAGTTLVMAAVDLSQIKDFGVYVRNNGAVALDAFVLEARPKDQADSYWVTVDNSTFATLAAAAALRLAIANNPAGEYRAHASGNAGTTDVDVFISGGG